MKHKSIPLNMPCEFINVTPLNPLISKCQIKVCYVGDEPNRNGTVITKDVARELANTIPGSPIVGYYNEIKEDFEQHNRGIKIAGNQITIEDTTKPYGFVDLGAKVWFQKFWDDDSIEREYLVTEGYLWTGQYPECERIITEGNNQSMELDEETLDGVWTKDANGKPQFFIINEAIMAKLCILGEDCEPCFEGSSITPVQFSFNDNFQTELLSMMKELKEYLLTSEGGTQVFTKYAVEIGDSLWSALYSYIEKKFPDSENCYCSIYRIDGIFEEGTQKFAVLQSRSDMKYYKLNFSITDAEGFIPQEELEEVSKTYSPTEHSQFSLADFDKFVAEYKSAAEEKEKEKEKEKDKEGKPDDSKTEDNSEGEDSGKEEDEEDKDEFKKKKSKCSLDEGVTYSLEEIPEYVELSNKFALLESQYSALVEERDRLQSEMAPLVTFKNEVERKEKQNMINNTFCMLSDEDKKDVIDNIDKYSLEDIEAKLSIICVRNKVNFNLDEDKDDKPPTVFNLGEELPGSETVPAWVKAALDVAKNME